MKYLRVVTLALIVLLAPHVHAVQTGECTGVYVETSPNHVPGLIQQGDVFEYWCELPISARADSTIDVTVTYPNAEARFALYVPRTLFGTFLGVFP